MQVLIFIGPPGSGKGSLAALCTKQWGAFQLSTGNLCRQHIAENTEIGKNIDFIIKSGKLISDKLIIDMVDNWITGLPHHVQFIILDGFPRTLAQAHLFNEFLAQRFGNTCTVRVIRIAVSDDRVVARLSGRAVCENNQCQAVYSTYENSGLGPQRFMLCDICSSPLTKRDDDREETIRERLTTYHIHECVLLDFYQKIGTQVYELDGERSFSEVFSQLERLLLVPVKVP